MQDFISTLERQFGADTPIFTKEVLDCFPEDPRSTVFANIKKNTASGALAQFDRGVYYLPRRYEDSRYPELTGEIPLNAEKVISKKYLTDGNTIYGFRSGLSLQNETHVSNQVPAVLEITTNKETNALRHIKPFGGYRDIILKKPRIPITNSNVKILKLLDLLTTVDIPSLNSYELERFSECFSDLSELERITLTLIAKNYPKRTLANIMESESHGILTH
ncbi:hypothetical protein [Bifidobacterium oedipodis]|uniref:Uncharacterized protein n=1 Tax=Bifidobacterium oedipodis TaxID=2675322 RepID=A0A7Y0ERF1_9BIFI|nr:hypothetical protein [Bifidobacterium sp. DSM 109957]NMM95060.1 hypothetical protein [Bifidobacterium sp. DSM 109957]